MEIDNALCALFQNGDLFNTLATLREGTVYRHLNGRITQQVTLNDKSYFLKYHRGVGWKEIIKNLLRGRCPVISAENEYRALKLLAQKNVRVPQVHGFAKQGMNPAKQASFILLESITPSVSLEEVILQPEKFPLSILEKRKIIEEVARMVREMHAAGVYHRDLYACHFLLQKKSSLMLTLIDFHRAQCFSVLSAKNKIKDVAGLYFSVLMAGLTMRDRLRFMRTYLNCSLKEMDPHTILFWQAVEKRAMKIYHRVYGFLPSRQKAKIEKTIYPGATLTLASGEKLTVTAILRVHPEKRIVIKGKYQGKAVVAKIYFHRLKRHLHAQREETGVLSLEKAGIQTPPLLCVTSAKDHPFQILLYEEILSPLPLFHLTDFSLQQGTLLRMVDTLVQHHKAGICQHDLHVGNFLMTADKVYTLDGDKISYAGKGLSQKAALENIALFLAQFANLTVDQQKVILNHYAKYSGFVADEIFYQNMEALIVQKIQHRGRMFLKKIYRDCTEFSVASHYKRYRVMPRALVQSHFIHALGDLDSVISKPGVEIYKNGNTCTVAKITIQNESYAIKRYNIKNARHFLSRFWRPSRAWRSWYGAHLFQFFGIPTVKPMALVENRWWKIRRKAYFLADLVEGEPLASYFNNPQHTEEQKSHIAQQTLAMLKKLYYWQIKHGDMKVTNFIVKNDTVYLIDLDSVSWFRCQWWFKQSVKGDWKRFFANWQNNPAIATFFETNRGTLS